MDSDQTTRRLAARDPVVALGLADGERSLVRRAAGGNWEVVVADKTEPLAAAEADLQDTVLVTSLNWLEAKIEDRAVGFTLLPWARRPTAVARRASPNLRR